MTVHRRLAITFSCAAAALAAFVRAHRIRVVNVAGPRASGTTGPRSTGDTAALRIPTLISVNRA